MWNVSLVYIVSARVRAFINTIRVVLGVRANASVLFELGSNSHTFYDAVSPHTRVRVCVECVPALLESV